MADSCGLMCYYPKWLQKYANSRAFIIVYGLFGTLHAASSIYFTVTLTTIEKRFKIPSQTTGIILSGSDISQVLLSLMLSYAGGQRNRPQWIACGVIFNALSCLILTWPHLIYGAGEDALQYTQEYISINESLTTNIVSMPKPNKMEQKLCKNETQPFEICNETFSSIPLIMLFLSQLVLGIGITLHFTLGRSYLDDNTHQRNTPIMFAYTFSLRKLGPTLGYCLAYVMLNIYIAPTLTPIITKDDTRWLGAWWMGWILLGSSYLIFAGLISMFPKHLSKKQKTEINCIDAENEKLQEELEMTKDANHQNNQVNSNNFSKALIRLLKNKLLMFNYVSSIFYILGSYGPRAFMGRVMEVQFNRSSAKGTIVTGPITIIGSTFGLLFSGYLITKFKPSPKYLFFWNVIIGLISMSGKIAYSNLGCDGENTLMLNDSMRSCNENCFCDGISYSPVCDLQTKETYFSPCHSGCTKFDKTLNVYTDCECTKSSLIDSSVNSTFERLLKPGACFNECDNEYYAYTFISMFISFFSSTAIIGNVLVNLRAVEPMDKSFAQGLYICLTSFFAYIPGPILYGRIIDSTCLIWNTKCGRRGNCQLYDPIMFRYILHITSASFIFLAAVFDGLVWYYGKNLKLFGDDDDEKEKKKKKKPSGKSPNNLSEEENPLNK